MKTNAIIYSIFHDIEYIKLLTLSLKSLKARGAIDFTTTDIVIYAEDVFETGIKDDRKDAGLEENCVFQYVPYRPPLNAACYKFLVLTNEALSQYGRFLYLDVDILITGSLRELFEAALEDRLYVSKYGSIEDPAFHGNLFTQEERTHFADLPTFTGSIFLFKRGPSVQTLFNNIMMHIRYNGYKPVGNNSFAEQPFLLYQAFRRDCVDTTLLTPFVSNQPLAALSALSAALSAAPINHFFGHPGCSWYKYFQMQEFAEKHRLFDE